MYEKSNEKNVRSVSITSADVMKFLHLPSLPSVANHIQADIQDIPLSNRPHWTQNQQKSMRFIDQTSLYGIRT